jgi:tetratricopeptide (TPR) repeat protein
MMDIGRAEQYYRRALAIDPDNAPVCRTLGTLYFHCGNLESARDHLLRTHELGYSTNDEWQEYYDANVTYGHGPHPGGGIPNLIYWFQKDVNDFVKQITEPTSTNEDKEPEEE